MRTKLLLICLIFVFSSGCSSHFVNYTDSIPVTETKLGTAFAKYQNPTDETAKIIVVRDNGFVGSLARLQFSINDEFIAKIYPGQSITLYLKPGEYMLASYGYSPSPENHLMNRKLKVTSGETYHYRISAAVPRGFALEKVSLN